MKSTKMLSALACLMVCLCFASGSLYAGSKTPGQKLDATIDSAKEKTEDTKNAADKKYEAAKKAAKEKSDDARETIAEKIKPSR